MAFPMIHGFPDFGRRERGAEKVPDMNCVICGSALERIESWNGDLSFNCPLCQVPKMTSKKEKEVPAFGLPRGTQPFWFDVINKIERQED